VAIGHGAKSGKGCLFVAQAGIAGSARIGDYCAFAGQSGVVGHIEIGNNVRVGGQAGVVRDLPPGQEVFGSPAIPRSLARKVYSVLPQLPELRDQVKKLTAELARLRARIEEQDRK